MIRSIFLGLALFLSVANPFSAQTWQPCLDWEAQTGTAELDLWLDFETDQSRCTTGLLEWMAREQNHDEALASAILTLGPRPHRLSVTVGETKLPEVPAGIAPLEIPLQPFWNGEPALVTVCNLDSDEIPVLPECSVRYWLLEKVVQSGSTLEAAVQQFTERKRKKDQLTWYQGGSGDLSSQDLSAKPAETVIKALNLDSVPTFELDQGVAPVWLTIEGPSSWEDAYYYCSFPATPAKVEFAKALKINGVETRIHGISLSNSSFLALWKKDSQALFKRLENWRDWGGNTVVYYGGPAPEQLLRSCMELGLLVFEEGDSRGRYLQEYACLTGQFVPGSGFRFYNTERTLGESPDFEGGPWIHTAVQIPTGWGGWLDSVSAGEGLPGYSGIILPEDLWKTDEAWNQEGEPLPGTQELRKGFADLNLRYEGHALNTLESPQDPAELWLEHRFGSLPDVPLRVQCKAIFEGEWTSVETLDLSSKELLESPVNLHPLLQKVWQNQADKSTSVTNQRPYLWDIQVLELPHAGSPLLREWLHEQIILSPPNENHSEQPQPAEMAWESEGPNYIIEADSLTYAVSARNGLIASIYTPNQNILPLPAEWTLDRLAVPGEHRPHTEQEAQYWQRATNYVQVLVAEVEGATLRLSGELMDGHGNFTMVYTLDVAGHLHMSGNMSITEGITPPLRVGMTFMSALPENRISWTGLGPVENYSDRSAGALWGTHRSHGELLARPYSLARETGNISAADHVQLEMNAVPVESGWSLGFTSSEVFSFSALPFVSRVQHAGQPWNRELDLANLTLNAYQAPLNLSGWNAPDARFIQWDWTLGVTAPTSR